MSPSLRPRRSAHSLFLDADRQYSCAYFETPDQLLDDAQLAKKRHLAAKLILSPGLQVLDIGCGWGGLGQLSRRDSRRPCGRHHPSQEQYAIARARAAERGLAKETEFRLQDYRDITGHFDRIVSVACSSMWAFGIIVILSKMHRAPQR